MSKQWFLHKDGKQYGPYTWEELTAFAREGRVTPGDSVWNSGMAAWVPAAAVAGLIPNAPEDGPQGGEAPSRAIPPSNPDGEELLGFIPALKKKTGLFRTKTYTLVVTNRRLIFAELTNKMMQAAVAEANEASKGKGMLARMKEAATSQQRIYSRYYNLTAEEILRENPENFALNNDEVKKVRMHIGDFYADQGNKQSDTMVIQTTREKIKLVFHYDNSTAEARKVLWRAFGNKVK